MDADHRVEFGMRGAETVPGTADGSAVQYRGVQDDVDLELAATGSGAKETLILNSRSAPTRYVFDLNLTGLSAQLVDGAVALTDAQGRQRATIPAGFMTDAGTATREPMTSYDVTYRLLGTGDQTALEVSLNTEWLDDPDRTFPVQVDPSVALPVDSGAAGSAMTVHGSSSSTGGSELLVGNQGGSNSAAYLKFGSLVNSLQYQTIYGAQLQVTGYDSPSCKARPVSVHPVTGTWTAGSGYSYPGPAVAGSLGKASFAYGYIATGKSSSACPAKNTLIDLGVKGRNLVQRWVNGTQDNNGLSLRAAAGDSSAWKRIAGSGTANAPRLYVTHTPYNAAYSKPKMVDGKPVLQNADGAFRITVTNKGASSWSPSSYYLAYRLFDKDGKALGQYRAASLPSTLARGAKVTLEATVKKLPAGSYFADFSMVGPNTTFFTDHNVPPVRLLLAVYDIPPVLTGLRPDNGYEAATLSPQLWARASDRDAPDSTLQYRFQICEVVPAGQTQPSCTIQAYSSKPNWVVPAGTLQWSKTYEWKALVKDSNGMVADSGNLTLLTTVPQPGVTSKIGAAPYTSREQDFDPQIGNLSTAAIEAPVINTGPDLNVLRTYNSLDPRQDGAFGAGWSSRYDMELVPDADGTGNVVVRYPDGQEVRFGKNPDGTFAPPTGRVAILTLNSADGSHTLIDRGKSAYRFAATGRLTRISDVYGRAIALTYSTANGGHLARAQAWNSSTNPAGRALTFTWSGNHVSSVSTDPVDGAALTWNYTYSGDLLTKACAPSPSEPICTTYDYDDGSHYRTAVLDDRPESYYRLGEDDDPTAASEVSVNLGADDGSYTAATPGTAGAIAGTSDTATTLNGTGALIELPTGTIKRNRDQAVELWFKTPAGGTGGPLVGYQDKALSTAASSGIPVLYVGTDGKLRGQLATGAISPITSTALVNDGAWHHAVLSAVATTQTLYLDGTQVGTLTGTISHEKLTYNQLGAAYATTPASWPGWGSTAKKFFTGSLDEAAFYSRPLGPGAVSAHHRFGRTAASELTKVTLPSGKIASEATYDVASDRIAEYTDRHGGTWKIGTPSLYGSATDLRRSVQVRDPANRPYLYEYDALAGRILRSGMPTGLTMREEDQPTPQPTTPSNPSECTEPDPSQPTFCTIVPGDAAGPVFYTLDGLSVRSYGYDAKGNQNLITDENGNTTKLTFDTRGNAISRTTCRTSVTDCQTDYSTYPTPSSDPTDPRNDLVTQTRDARSASATDSTYLTTYTYDLGGNLATQKNPDGGAVSHVYTSGNTFGADNELTPKGLLAKTTDALNAVTKFAYLKTGDLDSVVESTGLKTKYTYDALGRKTSETLISDEYPDGLRTTFGYDTLSRMTSMVEPATTDAVTGVDHQRRTAYSYDGDGAVTATEVSDVAGNDATRRTTFDYDDFGNVVRTVDAEGGESTYGFDRFGNMTSMVDALQRRYEYGYTARNNLAESRLWDWNGDPSSAPSDGEYLVLHSYSFDLGGRMASDTDAMGRRLEYSYNLDNTLKQLTLKDFHNPDGTTRDYVVEARTYDAAGNVTRESSGNNTMVTNHTYTPTGQALTTTVDPNGLARKTAYTYDANGNVLSTTQSGKFSNVIWPTTIVQEAVSFTYDTAGRQLTQTQTSGTTSRTVSYGYDQRGLLTSVTDPRGNSSSADAAAYTTTFGYDEQGRRTRVKAAAVTVESDGGSAATVQPVALTGYDTFDDTVAVKDANGNVSTATVDRLGRQTAQVGAAYLPPGSTTAITPTSSTQYDAIGNVTQETDARGNTTRYGYDRLDRLSSRSDPTTDNATRAVWNYAYSRTGEVLSVTDPLGGRVESTYDDLDRPITTTQVERTPVTDNYTSRYTYDDTGNATTITSPTGAVTTSDYDSLGQLVTTTDPSDVATSYGYDGSGREVLVTDGGNRSFRTQFDSFGQAISSSDISASNATLRTQSYEYDLVGNLVTALNPLGTERTYTYDALGHLTEQTEPVTDTKSITTSFGYDAAGNRTRYTDGRGKATITTYNSWELPESVIEPSTTAHPAAADRTWSLAYDANANPVRLTAPGGVARTRSFDAADRLTGESGTGAAATVARSLGYDSLGQLTRASTGTDGTGNNTFGYNDRGMMTSASGPGGTASFGYDGDGNLTNRTDAAGSATFGYVKGRLTTEQDGVTAATQTLGYDDAGALETIDFGSGRLRTYSYDDFGRLASDRLTNSATAVVSSIAYQYDVDDRMTRKTTTGTAAAADNRYGYDQAGRMTSWTKDGTATAYAWDDSGNRTQAGTKTASFDARNRLLSDSDYTYAYTPRGTVSGRTSSGLTEQLSFDAFDRLVTQGSTTYTYDGLDRMATRAGTALTYAGASDELVSDGTEVYAHGAYDELLAIGQGTAKRTTLSDQHGDLVAAFDTTNTALTSLDDSVAFDPFGQVLQSSGAEHNLGFQGDYTDPTTGEVNMGARWYTPGTGSFLSRDSASYGSGPSILANGYTYGAGAPMDYTDPDGNWPSCSLCHKVTRAVSHAVSSTVSAVRTAATHVYHAVQHVASKAWSAVKAVGRAVASAAKSIYTRAKAAVSWVGSKISSAGAWAAQKAAAAASWARERAETARRAAIAHAKAVTATAKRAVAAAIKKNPLPAIKAALKPVLAGVKTLVSAAADLPASIVTGTKNAVVDAAKSTQALYQKSLDQAGVVIEAVSTAASAAGEFATAAMPMVLGIAAGVATAAACMAVAGPGNPVCIVAGFAVGGAVTSALQCAPGRSVAGCAARGGAAGAVAGAVTVATGGAAAGAGLGTMVTSSAAAGAAGDAATQYLETGNVNAGQVVTSAALGGATGGLTHGLSRGCNSFVPGTRVLMADGSTKAIEDVAVGDLVLATDPTTGKTAARPVTDLITGTGEKRLVALTMDVDGVTNHTIETITATDAHPFWVDGNGEQFSAKDDDGGHWSDAGDLRTGDRLKTPKGGGSVAVLDSESRTEVRTVYNLTIDGIHTYYVLADATPVLVHNCGDLADAAANLPKDWPRRSTGILDVGVEQFPLSSGPGGPSHLLADLPGRKPQNFDHVETHAAAFLRNNPGTRKSVLYVQNNKNAMCGGCAANLNDMLPEGAQMWVYVNGNPLQKFVGNSR